ncbi:MAG: DsrE family protein [Deltaproteobacteria bacterium]|nr:DsrE family protein [Deltaproteobacteria bacterium]
MAEPYTDSVVVVCSCGTDNPNRSTRALFLAMAAHKAGKKVTVFLLDEGVFLARKGMIEFMRAATGDAADDHLKYLQDFETPILVCTPCAKARQITENDLIDGARMATGAELINLATTSAVISL